MTEEEFQRLYSRYIGNVLGLLVRLCGGDRAEAEDLTQDTFVAAYQGRERFQYRSAAKTWLMRIAVRRWRDSRRRISSPTESLPDEESQVTTDACATTDIVEAMALDDALNQLSPPFREALLLVAQQGCTYREAAAILGEPVGTVKWRVFEATRRMRAILRAAEEEWNAINTTTGDRPESAGSPPGERAVVPGRAVGAVVAGASRPRPQKRD